MDFKKNVLFLTKAIFALTFSSTFFSSIVLASGYNGRLDSVSGNTISGWAWDSSNPDHTPSVTVQIKKMGSAEVTAQTTVAATEDREDLAALGKGDGRHGFRAIIDWSALEDGIYQVEASVDGELTINSLTYQNGEAVQSMSLSSLGKFKTTAYCPCRSCSGKWGRRTSTGAIATVNHTIAVDPRVIPYGTKLMINGVIYTAEDRGGGVKGRHIDIFFENHGEALVHGVRNVEVFLVQ